jgi:omega-hydroxy-beta-dihydromenaquinone-9 sulfotransferase
VSVREPLFVGGTGRSGTSRMNIVLGSHRDVHAIHWESRFIVDPGGLEDVARVLTVGYQPYAADDALRRLAFLLGQRVAGRSMEAFRRWGLVDEIGPDRYWAAVDELFAELTWYEFYERVPPGRHQQRHLPGEARANRRVVGRYFADRSQLLAILRRFVSALFEPVTAAAGKATWVEKTPFNVLSVPFLWELYPRARFVHMIRDPLFVVASHLHQPWAPRTLDDIVNWVEPVYRRLLDQRPVLAADPRYIELRLEDAAADWPAERPHLLNRLGLPDDPDMLGFDPGPVHRRADQLSADDRRRVLDRLGDVREGLGY